MAEMRQHTTMDNAGEELGHQIPRTMGATPSTLRALVLIGFASLATTFATGCSIVSEIIRPVEADEPQVEKVKAQDKAPPNEESNSEGATFKEPEDVEPELP